MARFKGEQISMFFKAERNVSCHDNWCSGAKLKEAF